MFNAIRARAGRPDVLRATLRWRKHRLWCLRPWCRVGSWTHEDRSRPAIASPRLSVTGGAVADAAGELGASWHAIDDVVMAHDQGSADRLPRPLTTSSLTSGRSAPRVSPTANEGKTMPKRVERLSDEELEDVRGGQGEQAKAVLRLLDVNLTPLPVVGDAYAAQISPVGWELVG